MGNQASGDWSDFSSFNPFNQQGHYHPYCEINNFNNQTEVTSSVGCEANYIPRQKLCMWACLHCIVFHINVGYSVRGSCDDITGDCQKVFKSALSCVRTPSNYQAAVFFVFFWLSMCLSSPSHVPLPLFLLCAPGGGVSIGKPSRSGPVEQFCPVHPGQLDTQHGHHIWV